MKRFLSDARMPIDNNDVERRVRQIAIGPYNPGAPGFIRSVAAEDTSASLGSRTSGYQSNRNRVSTPCDPAK